MTLGRIFCAHCAIELYPINNTFPIGPQKRNRRGLYDAELHRVLALPLNSALVFNPCPRVHGLSGNVTKCYFGSAIREAAKKRHIRISIWHSDEALIVAKIGEA